MEPQELVQTIGNMLESQKSAFSNSMKDVAGVKASIRALEEQANRWPRSVATVGGSGLTTPGKAFTRSEQFQALKSMTIPRGRIHVDVPNPLMLEQKAFAPVLSPTNGANSSFVGTTATPLLPAPGALSLVSTMAISGGAVEFLRLSGDPAGRAKAQFPEGSLKATLQLTVADVLEKVQTIALYTKCSVQLLTDAVGLESAIDGLLMSAVLYEADRELLLGVVANGELDGIIAAIPAYNTASNVTGDNVYDVLSHAVAQLGAKGIVANGALVTPAAAEKIRIQKDAMSNYVNNNFSSAAIPTLWGMTIVPDPNLTGSGTDFVVANWSAAYLQLLVRQDASVMLSLENEDDFVKNLCTIRCEMRAATGLYAPSAFLKGAFPSGALQRELVEEESNGKAPRAEEQTETPRTAKSK